MRTMELTRSFMADGRLRGLSPKTLETYQRHCNELEQLSPHFPPKPEIIQEFLSNVKGEYNADSHWRTYHAIGAYAEKRHKIPNFMLSVTRPRIHKQIMPTISDMDLNLLAVYLDQATPRDKAILCLFIDTAIRKGEASNLQRKDIGEDRIIVHGKSGYRVAPISETTRDLLLSLPVHDDGFVFHGTNRGKNSARLSSTGFYTIVKKYLRKVGYSGNRQFGPQTLRRSFGRFHLKDGGDMQSLSLMLGHKNISTTASYYAPLLTEDVIEIHHNHSPGKVFAKEVADGSSD